MTEKNIIPVYTEINDFLASIPSPYISPNPDFFCLRIKENDNSFHNYKAPYRKDFYFIDLVNQAGKTTITYDNTTVIANGKKDRATLTKTKIN